MKKYILQLVFFTSLIEIFLILFFNFFNFTKVILFTSSLINKWYLNYLINFISIFIINLIISYIYLILIKKDNIFVYFMIGIFIGLIYFGLYKIINYHEIIRFIDILTIILLNIFKTYMICYSLFYKYLL